MGVTTWLAVADEHNVNDLVNSFAENNASEDELIYATIVHCVRQGEK